jgi:hypothetical protein
MGMVLGVGAAIGFAYLKVQGYDTTVFRYMFIVFYAMCCLGILSMAAGLSAAVVNLFRFGSPPRVGIGGGILWVLSFLIVPVGAFDIVKNTRQVWNLDESVDREMRKRGVANVPNRQPPADPNNNPGPGFDNPPPGFNPPQNSLPPGIPPRQGPPQQEVRVALSNGRISKRTGPFNTPQMGVEFRVDYNIETGRAMGEKYVLMIKTSKSRGKLTTFHLRGSGTIAGFSPIAAIEDGPFEAWMELESFAGRNSRKVSDSITLQVVEASQPPPQNNPPGVGPNPDNRPGMPPGLPPRGNRGPRGFPGGRP